MRRRRSTTTNLRAELTKALNAQRVNRALELYELIEERDPDEPRWSHRKGDLLQRMGRKADTVVAYERCVELYAAKGFVARAAAMAKLILAIDPSKGEVLERVDPEAARRLHRQHRSGTVAAVPLTTDQAALSDPIRFTKAERAPQVKLAFTDVELGERPPPPEPLASLRPSAGTLAQLPSMLLFAEVPTDILEALVRESTLIDVEDGQRFVTAGTSADALYVLVEGNAVGQRGTDTQSLLLGEGDVAGVSCLLSDVNYGEDVMACGQARVLRISKLLLERLVAQHPLFDDVLLEILSRRLVAALFRTSPVFSGFDETTRTRIAGMFEVRRAVAGTKLLEAGRVSDGMYVPLHGRIIARKKDGTSIGYMELGRALGHESILTRRPSPVSFEAASDVLVLRMPADTFSDLLLKHPDVVQQIDGRQRRHTGRTYSLGAGRITGVQ